MPVHCLFSSQAAQDLLHGRPACGPLERADAMMRLADDSSRASGQALPRKNSLRYTKSTVGSMFATISKITSSDPWYTAPPRSGAPPRRLAKRSAGGFRRCAAQVKAGDEAVSTMCMRLGDGSAFMRSMRADEPTRGVTKSNDGHGSFVSVAKVASSAF